MKHFNKLILAILFFAGTTATAQLNYNGEFDINNGNDDLSCSSFTQGSMPGWHRTHGSPRLFSNCIASHDPDLSTEVELIHFGADAGDPGEGIAAGYHFQPGIEYTVRIGYCYAENFNSSLDKFIIKAISNLPSSAPTCSDPIPTVSGEDLVRTFTNITIINGSTNRDIAFKFTASNDRNYLWLYPQTFDDHFIDIHLRYVYITAPCQDDIWFIDGTGGVVPAADYVFYKRIFHGSHWGSFPNVRVENDATQDTKYIASEYVLFEDKALLHAIDDGSFLAMADPYTCDHIPYTDFPPVEGDGDSEGKPGRKDNTVNTTREGNNGMSHYDIEHHSIKTIAESSETGIGIAPNPNNGSFRVVLKQKGTYRLKVMNAIGEVVHDEQLVNTNSSQVQLDSQLPAGVYIVQVKGENAQFIEKITITR